MQMELEASNALYADLYNRAPVGHIVFNSRCRLRSVNFAACTLLGYPGEMMLKFPFVVHIATEDLSKFHGHMRESAAGQGPVRAIIRMKHRTGHVIPVEFHTMTTAAAPNDSSRIYRTILVDLTERHESEEALRQSETRYRTLAEAMPQFVLTATPEGEINYCNRHAQEFTGMTHEEFASNWLNVVHPDDRNCAQAKWAEAVRKAKVVKLELRYRRKADMAYVWHECKYCPVRGSNGEVSKLLSIATDIQHRKEAEEEAERLLSQLRFQRCNLAQTVRERTAKLWKTNRKLSGEITERRRLEREILKVAEEERRRFGQELHDGLCQTIFGASLMTKSLSHRLKQRSRIEAEKADKIASLLTNSVDEARKLARGLFPPIFDTDGLVSSLHELAATSGEKPVCRFVCGSRVRLENDIVALNLYRIAQEAVANAVKHSAATKVTINLHNQRGKLLLSIVDNGKGLSTKGGSPNGLGFHTMGYRARLIGGSLIFHSSPDQGTTILCSVPTGSARSGGNRSACGLKAGPKSPG